MRSISRSASSVRNFPLPSRKAAISRSAARWRPSTIESNRRLKKPRLLFGLMAVATKSYCPSAVRAWAMCITPITARGAKGLVGELSDIAALQYMEGVVCRNDLICMDSMHPTHTLHRNINVTKPQSGKASQKRGVADAGRLPGGVSRVVGGWKLAATPEPSAGAAPARLPAHFQLFAGVERVV